MIKYLTFLMSNGFCNIARCQILDLDQFFSFHLIIAFLGTRCSLMVLWNMYNVIPQSAYFIILFSINFISSVKSNLGLLHLHFMFKLLGSVIFMHVGFHQYHFIFFSLCRIVKIL